MALQLLLLLLLTVRSESETVGKDFIAVFPENIAYYHPSPPANKVRITALQNSTSVSLVSLLDTSTVPGPQFNLESGGTEEVDINPMLELDKSNMSTKVVSITSNNNITVEILSRKNNSVQTALLFPTDQLGTQYLVPPIPQLQGTTPVTTDVTERSPFKLIIVTKEPNTIYFDGTNYGSIPLEANKVAQVWVYADMVGKTVRGDKPFLVLFGHSCAIQFECTCGVLYTPLLPQKTDTLKFHVPPIFNENAENATYLLMPSGGDPVLFSPSSKAMFETSGTVVLQRPGLLINLIPETEFGSCYAVQKVADATENYAIIMVNKDKTGDTQIGTNTVSGSWQDVPGTDYKYVRVPLDNPKNIIWHKSARMAVWFVGKKVVGKVAWFGNPAARISKDPDYRGCVLIPEALEVLEAEGTWQESLQACKNRSMNLISLPDLTLQSQVYGRLLGLNQNLTELWIGLRRCSYTGDWYWISEDPVGHTDWGQGEPGSRDQGQCALLSLRNRDDPGWTDEECCRPARPVCYRLPLLMNMI